MFGPIRLGLSVTAQGTQTLLRGSSTLARTLMGSADAAWALRASRNAASALFDASWAEKQGTELVSYVESLTAGQTDASSQDQAPDSTATETTRNKDARSTRAPIVQRAHPPKQRASAEDHDGVTAFGVQTHGMSDRFDLAELQVTLLDAAARR